MKVKYGKVKANCNKSRCLRNISIDRGIHVYRQKKDADFEANGIYYRVVVKCYAFYKDLIGANNSQMVFNKIYVPKSEYQRVFKKVSRRKSK